MDADLRKHLVDTFNMADAMRKVTRGQEQTNWYYYSLTIKAQLDAVPPPPPPPAKPSTVTGKVVAKVPVISSISTPPVVITGGSWPPAGSVAINPGDSWATKVSANPAGTVFAIYPGTHNQASVTPKANMSFIGPPGTPGTYCATGLTAILDGQNVPTYAFNGGNINGVTIKNLEVKGYKYAQQTAAINGSRNSAGATTSGWLIDNCYVHDNGYCGIGCPSNSTVSHCRMYHNAYQGYMSDFTTNPTFVDCEIDHNWTAHPDDPWGEASGGKAVQTTGLIMRRVYSHDNNGSGFWTDINNYQTLYDTCTVANNTGMGIFHEISYDWTCKDNTISGNGGTVGSGSFPWNAGIVIAASGSITGNPASELYGNTISSCGQGIVMVQQNRGSGNMGAWIVQNNYAHDNHVTNCGPSGAYQDISNDGIYSANNRWDYNDYHQIVGSFGPFFWLNNWRAWSYWQATGGQDTHGTLV